MDNVAARFNDVTHYRYGRIIDFLKLHYILTKRTDTRFWVDIVDPNTVPDRLKNLMQLWKYQPPWFFDEFDRLEEVFPAASYQYVMYGMGFETRSIRWTSRVPHRRPARHMKENFAPHPTAEGAVTQEPRPASKDPRLRHAAHLRTRT